MAVLGHARPGLARVFRDELRARRGPASERPERHRAEAPVGERLGAAAARDATSGQRTHQPPAIDESRSRTKASVASRGVPRPARSSHNGQITA